MGPLAAEHEAGAVQEHCWEAGMACEAAEDRDWRKCRLKVSVMQSLEACKHLGQISNLAFTASTLPKHHNTSAQMGLDRSATYSCVQCMGRTVADLLIGRRVVLTQKQLL